MDVIIFNFIHKFNIQFITYISLTAMPLAGDSVMFSVDRYDIDVSYTNERISTICILSITTMRNTCYNRFLSFSSRYLLTSVTDRSPGLVSTERIP
jgi:hypothetical protein